MTSAHLLSPRVYFPIHCRRHNRHHPSELIPRHRPTRHILCGSTLPLRPINRSSICYHGGRNTLIPTIHRILAQPDPYKNSILSNIRRSKHNILPTTLPGTFGNTTSILGFPRCLHPVKHHFINRLNHFTGRSAYIPVHCLRSNNIQTNPTNPTR